jgi:radical SAM superfamily enzyme YgiQ (UPF0313 family)
MQLPLRTRHDRLLRSGELIGIRQRLRRIAPEHELTSVVVSAFDRRTHILPFYFSATRMAGAGPRAIGAALLDSGFQRTRVALQQWTPNLRPSRLKLDGRTPDLLLISSMQIHSAEAISLIRDACRIDPEHRPLVVVGGPKMIYEPWDAFSPDRDDPRAADVAVTGEEYVLLRMLEVVLAERGRGESVRQAFYRAAAGGALDEVPGLVYPRHDGNGRVTSLVDTGMQRLVEDLDELPHAALGYGILERPHRGKQLSSRPMTPRQVRLHTQVAGLVMTMGCRFGCPYCPIPMYNQRHHRAKSGGRIADEMARLNREYGFQFLFGADDNFFNDPERTEDICKTLSDTRIEGKPLRKRVRWGTEATVQDTLRMGDRLRLARRAGMRALWLGVEDLTGTLVSKGQSPGKTHEAFKRLRRVGISPIAMMMHHDGQPLLTRGDNYGLLNQVHLLHKAGSVNIQVLMITPAPGSKSYEQVFSSGLAYDAAGHKRVENHMMDGNFVVASNAARPWRNQWNLLAAAAFNANPLRLLRSLVRPNSPAYLMEAGMLITAMWGLPITAARMAAWALRLHCGPIEKRREPPRSRIPMSDPHGEPAAHALPETPLAKVLPASRPEPARYVPQSEEGSSLTPAPQRI